MKKLVILSILLISLTGCKSEFKDLYGNYVFDEVTYLSPLSSSTKDYVKETMSGTKYIINEDLFKVESSDYTIEILSPQYIEDDDPYESPLLFGLDDFFKKTENRYVVVDSDDNETDWRIFTSSDSIWISSRVNNAPNGSLIVFEIYKLKPVE